MPNIKFNTALIVGAGSGLSAALARVLHAEGIKVALAARSTGDLDGLAKEVGGATFTCDASKRADVEKLFSDLDGSFGAPEIVIYNPSFRTRGPIAELDPDEVEKSLMITAFGGFLVGQQAVKRMLPKKRGCVVFTGASASIKGFAQSAPFAMGKFALRGLAQSMSRELHPKGIHVVHMIIDGGIRSARRLEPEGKTASLLNPTSIAAAYLHVIHQPHSAWSSEMELRPWVESF
ncbi:MAG: SDR family NAD(P)-dependent oxidoreductase [Alphaproteobacteria bacterium]|nr:SDR family NAD(P)-dependent oxidoreductase [Alphaproteobacteria bacterium]